MSLNIFLMLCILGMDFLLYVLFKWIYGDKRSAIARQVAACREALKEESPRPFLVTSQNTAPGSEEPQLSSGKRVPNNKPSDPHSPSSYSERIA
jgi:hypothetical protein